MRILGSFLKHQLFRATRQTRLPVVHKWKVFKRFGTDNTRTVLKKCGNCILSSTLIISLIQSASRQHKASTDSNFGGGKSDSDGNGDYISSEEYQRLLAHFQPDITFKSILAVNTSVFLLITAGRKFKKLGDFMLRHFVLSTSNVQARRFHVFLTAGFSHQSLAHLGINMYCLWTFSNAVHGVFGRDKFLMMYGGGLCCAALTSFGWMVITKSPIGSIGASGAIMAILAAACTLSPDSHLKIVFTPEWASFSAASALKGLVIFDVCGLFYSLFRRNLLDHAGHLGGVAFGYCYFLYLKRTQGSCESGSKLLRGDTVYKGPLRNFKAHGLGCSRSHNMLIQGEFRDDLPHGRGSLQLVGSGTCWNGYWNNGQMTRGTFFSKDGSVLRTPPDLDSLL